MPILHKCLCSTSEPHLKDQITKLSRNDRATCKLVGEKLLSRLKDAGEVFLIVDSHRGNCCATIILTTSPIMQSQHHWPQYKICFT
ncbi:hypothetical protein WJX74_008456 [Apatococcus lobatus]|uniref:Uncharacterized protein n=1 Tax=Apatococcus lobatus TaxID=904363 RepID=A0AAW1S827_9CHLO